VIARYRVKTRLPAYLYGRVCPRGELVELTEAQATPLLAAGILEVVAPKPKARAVKRSEGDAA
jgi:hypothetical protein